MMKAKEKKGLQSTRRRLKQDVIYVKKVVTRKGDDGKGYSDIIRVQKEVTVTFSMTYDNFLPVMMELNALEICLLFFLSQRTGNDGSVMFARFSKEKFQTMVEGARGRKCSKGSIDNALLKLVKKEILFRVALSTFRINPLFVTRNLDQKMRLRSLEADADTAFDKELKLQRLNDEIFGQSIISET
jgi:hypothetical protein